jgi:hypothetical protein
MRAFDTSSLPRSDKDGEGVIGPVPQSRGQGMFLGGLNHIAPLRAGEKKKQGTYVGLSSANSSSPARSYFYLQLIKPIDSLFLLDSMLETSENFDSALRPSAATLASVSSR